VCVAQRSGRKDGINLLREDEKYRWTTMVEVDFLAGDQSVMALRFTHGSTQLRFGDDFGLSIFKRELRRLLPQGIDHWRRAFGYHVEKKSKDEGDEEGDEQEDDEEGLDQGAAGDDPGDDAGDGDDGE
jgi:hypothetical protein